MGSLTARMQGAAMLDVNTYEEVEHDLTATGQAATVVAIAAVAQAIGSAGSGGPGIIAGLLGQLIGWAVWAGLTYFVGTRLFNGTANWGELLRTIGFSQAPGVLFALGIIPLLGAPIRFVVGIWVLVAGVIAIRQALDVSTGKAVITAIISAVVLGVLGAVLGMLGLAGLVGR